jgi:hypothetical protein
MWATASGGTTTGKMPDVCVQRGVEDALLGHLPGEDQPLRLQPPEQIVQRCGVERAVPHLDEKTAGMVRVTPAGPILVEGPVHIELPDGTCVDADRFMVAICTCLHSNIFPLCGVSNHSRFIRSDQKQVLLTAFHAQPADVL